MDTNLIVNSLLLSLGLITIIIFLAVSLRAHISRIKYESVFRQLPEGFSCISGKDKTIIGSSGVWLVNDGAKIHPTDLASRARVLASKFQGQFVPDVKVQPVLLTPDSKSGAKFSFSVDSGVFIVSRKWLNKLITENPVGDLDSVSQSKIRDIITS